MSGFGNSFLGYSLGLSDVWMFNSSDGTWKWLQGEESVSQIGSFPTFYGALDPYTVPVRPVLAQPCPLLRIQIVWYYSAENAVSGTLITTEMTFGTSISKLFRPSLALMLSPTLFTKI